MRQGVSPRAPLLAAGLLAACLLAVLVNLSTGAHATTLGDAVGYLWHDDGSNAAYSVRELRLPRILCALGVGAAMAVSGALIQIVIRNPLGDPGLTGVSAGAAFGVAITLATISAAPAGLLTASVTGGGVAAGLTFLLARGSDGLQPIRVILAGIAVSVFFLAATSAVMILSRSSMQTLYYWMIGGFINRGWDELSLLWPVALAGFVAACFMAPILKPLQFDNDTARAMGVNASLWRLLAMVVSVALAAVSVSVAGPLGFVGFVTPHLVRLCLGAGADMLTILGVTAIAGAALVSWADTAARLLLDGNVPAGALTTIPGALIFLFLARRGLARAV